MSNHDSIQDAIKRLHGCDSKHVESVRVTETWQGETVWDGTVEVFDRPPIRGGEVERIDHAGFISQR